jgi:lipopolysaccharide transport system permease protein
MNKPSVTIAEEYWTTIIVPETKFLDLRLREVIKYRDLVFLFVKRDFITKYKQTVLGPLWYVIQPLISTIMFAFVFGNLAKISTDGLPYLLFYYGGNMLWMFFENCFKDASDTFTTNAALFGKVYFPRLTVPISRVFINLIAFAIQFVLLSAFFIYYAVTGDSVHPSISMLYLPLILVWLASLGIGLGLVVSAITTKYRDLKQLVSFGVGLWMYATPIVYPLSQIPQNFKWLYYINPVSAPIEFFRVSFYGAGYVPPAMILSSVIISVFAIAFGLIVFNRNERTFIDVA